MRLYAIVTAMTILLATCLLVAVRRRLGTVLERLEREPLDHLNAVAAATSD